MSDRFLKVTLPILILSCLVVVVLVFVLMPITPPWARNQQHAEHLLWQANLRTVASVVMDFPSKTADGQFPRPDQYGEALMNTISAWPDPLFGPDDTQDDIWIIPLPWPDRRIPEDITPEQRARTPLLHERVDLNPDGTSVAFWDGSVRLLTNEEFEAIIDAEKSVCLACEFAMPELMKSREP